MADILIRGMEMPDRRTAELMHTELACVSRECDRHCENCDLVQDRDELIVAFREAIRVLETVANAVPLPAGHGDLIDRDAFRVDNGLNAKCEHCPTNTYECQRDMIHTKMEFCGMLDDAPVIVPAEGGTYNEYV